MIGSFGGQDAGVEFKVLYLEGFLAEKAVPGKKIGDFLCRAVFQTCKGYMW